MYFYKLLFFFALIDCYAYNKRHVSLTLLTRISEELKLDYLVTDPRYSGSGVGTFMLDNIYTYASFHDEIQRITLEDASFTVPVMPFYEDIIDLLPDYLTQKISVNPEYTEPDTGRVNISKGKIADGLELKRSAGFYERWMIKKDRTGLSDVVGNISTGYNKFVTISTAQGESPLNNGTYDSDSPPYIPIYFL